MIKAILFLLLALPATAQTFHIEVDGGIAESPVFSNRYTPWLTVNEPEIKVVWRLGLPAVRPWNTLEARSDTCRTFSVPFLWNFQPTAVVVVE